MRKPITTAVVAMGLLGLAACAKSDDTAGNTAEAVETTNLTGDEGALGNDVTAADGDAATLNAADAAALPADDNVANVANLTGNAAEASGNGF